MTRVIKTRSVARPLCLLALAGMLVLAGACSGGGATKTPTRAPSTPLPTPQPAPSVTGQTVVLPSGLSYIDIQPGTGAQPKDDTKISVEYDMYTTAGRVAGTDPGKPLEVPFGPDAFIPGMVEGIRTMRAGGKRRLIIPPQLAFGAAGLSDARGVIRIVGANETVTVDVTLVSVE